MKPPESRKAELGPNASGGEKSHAETAESAEFKMTELGPIPVDWEVKRLGECCTRIKNGFTYSVCNRGSYKISRIETISKGVVNYSRVGYVKDAPPADYMLSNGDILFSHINSLPYIGNVALYDGKELLYHGMNLLLLRCNESANANYLYYALSSSPMRSKARELAKIAINQASISIGDLSRSEIPRPPLAEQRRIAGALSDVDELISALGKLIEKKRNIKTGAMQELLTGKTRLPGFKGKWVEKCIGDMTCVVTGATPSTAREDFWGGSIRWMSSGELNYKIVAEVEGRITKEGFEACSTHIIPVGCVLIGLAGQGKTRGTAAYNLVEMCTNQSIASILPTSSFHSKFLYYYMDRQYDELRLISAGDGGRGGLTKGDIEKFSIRIPPTLAEQKAIAAVLSDIDAEIAALEADRAKYERIKSGMMQELLTGKTRLKGM